MSPTLTERNPSEPAGALAAAMAELTSRLDAVDAAKARVDADWIVIRCRAIRAQSDVTITGHGWAGFDQLTEHLQSSAHVRKNRAGNLLLARRQQLKGHSAADALGAARRLRVEEKHRAGIEDCAAKLAVLDVTLAAYATEHAEGRIGVASIGELVSGREAA